MNVEDAGVTSTTAQPMTFVQGLLASVQNLGTQYIQTTAAARIAAYQQQQQAKTWNAANTGAALNALSYQRAYEAEQRALLADRQSGSLSPISTGITTKTLLIVAGVGLGAYFLLKK
jgi:hypothetical protein